jgi:hypothetical protein
MKKLTLIKNGKATKIKCDFYKKGFDIEGNEIIDLFYYGYCLNMLTIRKKTRIQVSEFDSIIYELNLL